MTLPWMLFIFFKWNWKAGPHDKLFLLQIQIDFNCAAVLISLNYHQISIIFLSEWILIKSILVSGALLWMNALHWVMMQDPYRLIVVYLYNNMKQFYESSKLKLRYIIDWRIEIFSFQVQKTNGAIAVDANHKSKRVKCQMRLMVKIVLIEK